MARLIARPVAFGYLLAMSNFRNKDVAAITGLDRLFINECVNNGTYHWAPPTIKGRARVWDDDELLALSYVSAQIQAGVGKTLAFERGLRLLRAVRGEPEIDEVNVEVNFIETVTVSVEALRGAVLDRKIEWFAPRL